MIFSRFCTSCLLRVFAGCMQAAMLLRIDDVLSGVRKEGGGSGGDNPDMDPETFGDARDG